MQENDDKNKVYCKFPIIIDKIGQNHHHMRHIRVTGWYFFLQSVYKSIFCILNTLFPSFPFSLTHTES